MRVCEAVTSRDPDVAALRGLDLQHDLYLSLRDWRAWNAVSARLIDAGADLLNIQIHRQGEAFSVRCRFKGLASEAARAFSAGLLDEGVATRAQVEHLLLARGARTT